jgi:hypothetical protein
MKFMRKERRFVPVWSLKTNVFLMCLIISVDWHIKIFTTISEINDQKTKDEFTQIYVSQSLFVCEVLID